MDFVMDRLTDVIVRWLSNPESALLSVLLSLAFTLICLEYSNSITSQVFHLIDVVKCFDSPERLSAFFVRFCSVIEQNITCSGSGLINRHNIFLSEFSEPVIDGMLDSTRCPDVCLSLAYVARIYCYSIEVRPLNANGDDRANRIVALFSYLACCIDEFGAREEVCDAILRISLITSAMMSLDCLSAVLPLVQRTTNSTLMDASRRLLSFCVSVPVYLDEFFAFDAFPNFRDSLEVRSYLKLMKAFWRSRQLMDDMEGIQKVMHFGEQIRPLITDDIFEYYARTLCAMIGGHSRALWITNYNKLVCRKTWATIVDQSPMAFGDDICDMVDIILELFETNVVLRRTRKGGGQKAIEERPVRDWYVIVGGACWFCSQAFGAVQRDRHPALARLFSYGLYNCKKRLPLSRVPLPTAFYLPERWCEEIMLESLTRLECLFRDFRSLNKRCGQWLSLRKILDYHAELYAMKGDAFMRGSILKFEKEWYRSYATLVRSKKNVFVLGALGHLVFTLKGFSENCDSHLRQECIEVYRESGKLEQKCEESGSGEESRFDGERNFRELSEVGKNKKKDGKAHIHKSGKSSSLMKQKNASALERRELMERLNARPAMPRTLGVPEISEDKFDTVQDLLKPNSKLDQLKVGQKLVRNEKEGEWGWGINEKIDLMNIREREGEHKLDDDVQHPFLKNLLQDKDFAELVELFREGVDIEIEKGLWVEGQW
jgi:hypothetical protein